MNDAGYNRAMGATALRDFDLAALLLIALALVFGAVVLGIAARRRRRLARSRRAVAVKKRLEVIVRDLDRMAEPAGDFPESGSEAEQAYRRGLAATGAYRWDEAVGHWVTARFSASYTQLAPLHHQAGVCRYMQGRLGDALEQFEQSARLAEQLEDKSARALALNNIGVIRHDCGELDAALEVLKEARALARESGNQAAEALCLGNIGNVHRDRWEHNAALKSHGDALAIARQTGDRQGVASSMGNIGSIMRDKGELDEARERYAAAVEASGKIGYKLGMAIMLGNLGSLYRDRGELDQALESHESALALARETGYRLGVAAELGNIGLLLVVKRAYDRAVPYLAQSLTQFLAAGTASGPRQTLYGLSRCDDALGRELMQALLQSTRLASEAVADALERIDQIRSRRPWLRGIQHNPFAPVSASPRLSGA